MSSKYKYISYRDGNIEKTVEVFFFFKSSGLKKKIPVNLNISIKNKV